LRQGSAGQGGKLQCGRVQVGHFGSANSPPLRGETTQ
jgi:hypothetical protein